MENLSSSAIVKHKTNSLYIFFYRGNCKNIFRCQRLDSKVYNGEDIELIGSYAKIAADECKKNIPLPDDNPDVVLLLTNSKNIKEYRKNWKSISFAVNTNKYDWVVPAQTIKSGYSVSCNLNGEGNKNYPSFHLPLTATNTEIGNMIVKAFDAIDGIIKNYNN